MKNKTGHSIPDQPESWRWPEEKWRGIVNKIRAGKSLKPDGWPNDAVPQSNNSLVNQINKIQGQ